MTRACCLALLLLCSSMLTLAGKEPERFTYCENPCGEKFCRRWQEMFGLRRIPNRIYYCLSYIDPRPTTDFVPFPAENLSPDFLRESKEWMKKIFRKEANPLAEGVKSTKRYLTKPGNFSLVLFDWENSDFRFQLTSNRRGLLLEARPKKGAFDPDKGVPAEQVVALLKRLLNLEAVDKEGNRVVPEDWRVEQAFHLPKQVSCGVPFDNMPRKGIKYYDSVGYDNFAGDNGWPRCVVGFLSTDALYLAIRISPNLSPPIKDELDYEILPDVDRNPEKFHPRWQQMFGLRRPIPEEVAACLAYVDPRPEKDFVPFRQEQLIEDFFSPTFYGSIQVAENEYDRAFPDKVFRKEINPWAKGIKPSKYYLSKPGESDLLLYQWESRDFRLRLTESCRGFLLEARPKKGPFDPNKGVPAEQVAALLKQLLDLEAVNNVLGEEQSAVPKGQSIEQAFHLPKLVQRGVPFHNIPHHDPWRKKNDPRYPLFFVRMSPLWPRCIVGFLSTDSLCVVIPKCDLILNGPAIPFDADWLRDTLVGKDGKTRLHKPLIERPWPRGK